MYLLVAFKGAGNSSNKLVSMLPGEKLFLTNSYAGLRKEIEDVKGDYEAVYMFGLDKSLKGRVRIEKTAQCNNEVRETVLSIDDIALRLEKNKLSVKVSSNPVQCLCNEAYWYMLQKYNGKAVFFHIPSIKCIDEDFAARIEQGLLRQEE